MKAVRDITFEELGDETFLLDLYLPDSEGHGDLHECSLKEIQRRACDPQMAQTLDCGHSYGSRGNCLRKDEFCRGECQTKDSGDGRNVDCGDFCEQGSQGNSDRVRENENRDADVLGRGRPFVVFIHGGGWRRGARDAWKHYLYYDVNFLVSILQFLVGTYSNVGEALATNGIPCAVISYPLTEANLGVVLFEMLLSYILCSFCVLLASASVATFAMILRSVFTTAGNYGSWELIFHHERGTDLITVLILSVTLLTNLIILAIISCKRKHFKLDSHTSVFLRVFLFALVLLAVSIAKSVFTLLFYLNCVTFVASQGSILRVRLSRQRRTYKDQLKVVSSAVRWTKTFCEITGRGDQNSLYLMGHSAGGHLATLTALSTDLLDDGTKIKGVISVSGVYDLLCLNNTLLKPVYLQPTFGYECDLWLSASPAHVIKSLDHVSKTVDHVTETDDHKTKSKERVTKGESHVTTKFLLLSAEKDPFLKRQSLDFHETLLTKGWICEHVEIGGTNHFSIITGSGADPGSPLQLTIDFISKHNE